MTQSLLLAHSNRPCLLLSQCSQMKAMFDATGGLWQAGKLVGKPATCFVSTGTQGGGQETTALTTITQLVHHGMIFVPAGYTAPEEQFQVSSACSIIIYQASLPCSLSSFWAKDYFMNGGWTACACACADRDGLQMTEIIGGSPYGAGTYAGPDGSRQPSDMELSRATKQGAYFAEKAKKLTA